MIARGGGCRYGDAAQNAGGIVAMTTADADLSELTVEDDTVLAGAGTTLGALVRALAPLGWTLPGNPGHRAGHRGRRDSRRRARQKPSAVRHVRRPRPGHVRLTPGPGELTTGPRTNPDAFWTTVGGPGLTGVIRSARLALTPLDSWLMQCTDTVVDDLPTMLSTLHEATEHSAYATAWIDAGRHGRQTGGGIVGTAQPVLPRQNAPYDSRHEQPRGFAWLNCPAPGSA